ncbi:hypothetical protein SASPL_101442 [Salvia splendens]|uniref:Uncharacterized protein n=1 Tax=Salvia splendens TaxID=180675 RepID=A0A8X9ADC3_SALSN|nr:hypothetical protein SASPL_101442 [Salvia splendens]
MDAVNNICLQENLGGFGVDNNYNVGFGDFFMPNEVPDQQTPNGDSNGSACETTTQNTSGKKRKAANAGGWQRFVVCGFILDKVERLDFFMGLRETVNEEYVLMVLEQLSPK